ncbi:MULTISPECIES: helix-turn-helix domain-containing protein [Streptococcus]|uniref:helix-turn-helix domain-containing protein n=1 Tax=Streptococcus TaxID=1301 RepID=UPI0020C84DDB|nr:helix-turn-helix domain-containing protein [Streptococcus sp. CF8_Ac1-9]MCP9044089.1 helix-turn-helix domain-containing protein [Streptococcus sp. CF8_Ac1-11]
MKNIREWFPHAEVTDQAHPPAGYVAIPLQAHQWLLLKEEELTEREKQLISLLGGEEEVAPNPWYQYLIDGKGEAPQVIKKMQLVYCHISHSTAEGMASWLEMMQTLLPNFRATLQLSGQDYVLILDQDQSLPVADILKDTVSAMEYDFNIRLSILVGQVWTESKEGKVAPVIRAEQAVFRAWIREGHQGVYRFSQLYLWGIEQAGLDLTPIKASLHQLIESQDQLQDIIVALWENGAVVTKAAQQLYLHRNSLQYKIDKWEELTGLQLKNLTDLALCYHLVLQDVI